MKKVNKDKKMEIQKMKVKMREKKIKIKKEKKKNNSRIKKNKVKWKMKIILKYNLNLLILSSIIMINNLIRDNKYLKIHQIYSSMQTQTQILLKFSEMERIFQILFVWK